MGLFHDILGVATNFAYHRDRDKPTSIEVAIFCLGTILDFTQCLCRHSEPKSHKLARDTWRGFAQDANLKYHPISNTLPENEASDLLYHIWGIGSILSLWASGALGNRPSSCDIMELKDLLRWSAAGAVFKSKWRYLTLESMRKMNAWQFLDYYLNDEYEQTDDALEHLNIDGFSLDLFDNDSHKVAV